jgi:hypothetical protein
LQGKDRGGPVKTLFPHSPAATSVQPVSPDIDFSSALCSSEKIESIRFIDQNITGEHNKTRQRMISNE